jgi:two-component system sensor histidine kinase BarA
MAGGAAYCGMPKVQKICNLVEVGLRGGKKLRDVEPELYELDDMLESAKKDRNLWIDELKN